MCYLVLIVTASFTPYWRCAILVILLCWSVYWGDLLAEIPFYTGALLADMSILLSKANNSLSTSTSRFERINKYWPMTLGIFGLLICSYPTNHADLAGWSRAMTHIGNMVLHPQCMPRVALTSMLIGRGTPMVLQLHWIRYSYLCNPLFPRPAPHFLSPLRSLLRQYFLPRLSHPLVPYALGSSVGYPRTHSRGTSVAAIFT